MSPDSSDGSPPSDAELARRADRLPTEDVVEPFGLTGDDLERYGPHVATLTTEATRRLSDRVEGRDARVVLVTAMTPTPQGEGKTVTTIGLAQALNARDRPAVATVREPSLGPVFGLKGGAAGGGHAQVLPMEDINLHFTGDLHAITAAHNLIAAVVDNHRHHGSREIEPSAVRWPRALDVNDRALRELVVGLGDANGPPREDGFVLTPASELMAVLCLAEDLADLRARIARIVVAVDDGEAVTVDDLGVTGAVAALLRDAFRPNVVQTMAHTPAFVHGGPFANIAHGTNSVVANAAGAALADYLVTEAGFGADLGAEKFFDLVCPASGIEPAAATLVVTVRALASHGLDQWPVDYDELAAAGVDAVRAGFENLDRHVELLREFGVPVVVAVNRFPDDTDEAVAAILEHCREDLDVRAAESTVHADGADGGLELADAVAAAADEDGSFAPVYGPDASVTEAIEAVATRVYGADGVTYTDDARDDLETLRELGYDDLPVCLSKTPYSFSDDPSRRGVPADWELTVRELRPAAGAGFVVALTGDVLTMPGLPERPAAEDVDLEADGTITGLF